MEAALIAFATTAATLSVTVVLALLEFRRRRREAVQFRREQIVGRVLDTLESATRAASRAPIVGLWTPNELEYALLLPRLLAELPAQDNAVATWVARRIQHLQAATSRREQIEIGADVAAKVVQWGRCDIDTVWFSEQLQVDPWVRGERPPLAARWLRSLRDGLQLVPAALLLALGAVALQATSAEERLRASNRR